MSLFHVDQRPVRARCAAILAGAPPQSGPDHEAASVAVKGALLQALDGCRLAPGTTPAGVRWTLWTAHRGGDLAVCRRSLERAIPARGALRPVPAIAALSAVVALTAVLAWLSPWLLAVPVLVGAWWVARWGRAGRAAVHVHDLERGARAAAQAGDVEAINALYAEARRMIEEDRVPAGVGFRLAQILRAAAQATPFPPELLRELRRLRLQAPETELCYDEVRDAIERALQLRVTALARDIRRAGEDAVARRAELRELARTAPGATGARDQQAALLRERAGHAAPGEVLDEIEELVERLASIEDRAARRRGSAGADLAAALDEVASAARDPDVAGRAGGIRRRLEACLGVADRIV